MTHHTPAYRYLLCDLLTDQVLADLPLSGVTFDRRISRTGSLSGQLDAPTPRLVAAAKLMHSYAGRAALWVYRDNQLWWGGIPWTVQAAQGERGAVVAQLQAATFDSYAHHRHLYADAIYNQVDQGAIIPDLWRKLQADPRGDIGVLAVDQPTGVLRDRTYRESELARVGKLIEDLGDVIDGPEHTIDTYLDAGGNRVKELRVAMRLGSSSPRVVFQRSARAGGRIMEWEHTADAVDGGTTFRARGDAANGNVGQAQEPLMSARLEATELLDKGWPLLDSSVDRAGVTDVDTLTGYAEAMRTTEAGALPTSGYTVQVGNTGWSPNRIGDAVRLKLRDDWHTTTTDLTVRPVGCQVTVPSKGKAEQVKLLLGEDES